MGVDEEDAVGLPGTIEIHLALRRRYHGSALADGRARTSEVTSLQRAVGNEKEPLFQASDQFISDYHETDRLTSTTCS